MALLMAIVRKVAFAAGYLSCVIYFLFRILIGPAIAILLVWLLT